MNAFSLLFFQLMPINSYQFLQPASLSMNAFSLLFFQLMPINSYQFLYPASLSMNALAQTDKPARLALRHYHQLFSGL